MALARIITHSDLCARELAFHLLGRGYAVEIVSPDSIPNNFADLELRVDGHSGDELVASLAAHEGQCTASFDFAPCVTTPIEQGVLMPPVVRVASHLLDNPVVVNVARSIADLEASTDSPYPAPQSDSLRTEDAVNREPRPDLGPDLRNELAAHLSTTEEPSPSSPSDAAQRGTALAKAELVAAIPLEKPVEPLSYFVRQTSSIAMPFPGPAEVLPTWERQTLDRSVEWKSIVPAALTLAAVLLLSLFLAFGVRASAKPPVGSSARAQTAASASANASSLLSEKVAMTEKPSSDLHIASRPNISSRRASQIAPNTVTYLDDRYRPAAKPKPLHARTSSTGHARGEVAADTATYFNSATSSKPAK